MENKECTIDIIENDAEIKVKKEKYKTISVFKILAIISFALSMAYFFTMTIIGSVIVCLVALVVVMFFLLIFIIFLGGVSETINRLADSFNRLGSITEQLAYHFPLVLIFFGPFVYIYLVTSISAFKKERKLYKKDLILSIILAAIYTMMTFIFVIGLIVGISTKLSN